MSPKAIIMATVALVVMVYIYLNTMMETGNVQQCDISRYPAEAERINGAKCHRIVNMDFSKFTNLKQVDLGHSNLVEIPRGLPSTVEVLLLGNNPIERISNVDNLPNLRILALRGCRVRELDGLSLPSSLLSLVLTENTITSVRNMRTTNLIKLMLSHNNLSTISDLPRSLQLLRLSNNPNLEITQSLFADLPTLRWVACSGIKTLRDSAVGISAVKLDEVSLAELSDRQKIGAGASGTVYSSSYQGKPVAIKFFRKSSSDGKSDDELRIMKHISHFDIVSPVAILKDNKGLLVTLVRNAESLGSPPTFDTIVRNVKKITITQALLVQTMLSISSAMAYLHKSGIAHGDLYAHNIIINKETQTAKLSDFGASWFVPSELREAVEAAEVRAFGALLEDLLSWMDEADVDSSAAGAALELSRKCNQPTPPPFSELEEFAKKVHRKRALDKIETYKKSAAEQQKQKADAL